MTGILHLFKAKSGHRLVVPEHLVFREDLANTRTPPARDVDLIDPAAVAREEGKTERQFIAEQKKVLKDAEEAKRKEAKRKAAEENARKENRGNTSNPKLKSALRIPLDKSINLSAQKEALKAFEEAIKKEQDLAEQRRENQLQKQHSWHPGSDFTYETIPDDGIRPHPVPRQNEGAAANSVDHEKVHQQQGQQQGGPGGYPQNYSQPPTDQSDPHRGTGQNHDLDLPHHSNTRPEGVQPPQPLYLV